MTRLVLIRHGESNTTVARRIGGYRTCTGLSPLGRLQSERLRDRLAETGEVVADAIVSSQFHRARETAEIVAPALGGLPILEDVGFGEHDPGVECDGMLFTDFVQRFGEESWDDDPFTRGFPGGETVAQFHLRVGEAMARVVRDHADQTVVIFCHGGVIDAALRLALHAPPTGSFDVWTVNTSLTDLQLVRPGRWRMLRYNDAAHLAGLTKETPKQLEQAAS